MRDALLIPAFINAVLSALIAWLVTLGEDEVPLTAVPLAEGPSVVADTVGTCFVLPFLTTLAITTVVWKEIRDGHLPRLPRAPGALAERLPGTRLRRATWIGVLCLLVFGPIVAVALLVFDYGDLGIGEFVLFKAVFGIVLGSIVTPPIAMAAFGDEPPPVEPAAQAA